MGYGRDNDGEESAEESKCRVGRLICDEDDTRMKRMKWIESFGACGVSGAKERRERSAFTS